MELADDEVTELLHAASGGNRTALDRLVPLIYSELRAIAHRQRSLEASDFTLNTTALVHEAYLKLVDQSRVSWRNRSHFFAIAARSIRRIIIDHAREKLAQKRGGGADHASLDAVGGAELSTEQAEHFVALDESLDRLTELDERQGKIVTYRYFGGLTIEETAQVLDISPATVKREWTMAKAWLHRELSSD